MQKPLVLGLVVLLVAATACSDDGSDSGSDEDAGSGTTTSLAPIADADAEAFEGGDFYEVPDPLPAGDHGTLIRYEETDPLVEGGSTWRVMYLSESLADEPIAVTGTVLVPDGEAPAEGWKLLTIAHGTSGNADECAPSKTGGGELALMGGSLAAGYVVAMTDYEGMGTPGRHPYLVGTSEGRSVLDAAIAARQLPDVEVGERYGIAGYSQGGHGAAWAHELAAEWAPDLDLVGTVSGAPPSEFQAIFTALAATGLSPDLFYLIVAGYETAYPEADPALVLTDAGLAALDGVDDGCFNIGDALGDTPWSEVAVPDAASVEPWATLLAANDPGQVATDDPMLIVHSADDEVVPAALSEAMFERLCGLGQVVERRVYDEGEGHVQAAISKTGEMFAWIDARMSGEPPISTCP